jgi:hypothetical protein
LESSIREFPTGGKTRSSVTGHFRVGADMGLSAKLPDFPDETLPVNYLF